MQNVSLPNYFIFKFLLYILLLSFWGCLHLSYMSGKEDWLSFISSQFYIQARQVDTLKLSIDRIYTTDNSKDNKLIRSLGFWELAITRWPANPCLFPSLMDLKSPRDTLTWIAEVLESHWHGTQGSINSSSLISNMLAALPSIFNTSLVQLIPHKVPQLGQPSEISSNRLPFSAWTLSCIPPYFQQMTSSLS